MVPPNRLELLRPCGRQICRANLSCQICRAKFVVPNLSCHALWTGHRVHGTNTWHEYPNTRIPGTNTRIPKMVKA